MKTQKLVIVGAGETALLACEYSVIRNKVFVSSHVVISGYGEVGESCFLGVNSCLGDNTKVARDCVIGAGAVVLKGTEPNKIYRGNPVEPANVSSLRMFGVRES